MIDTDNHRYCLVHDWWIYLIALNYGRVIYDTDSYIYYRQHDGNEIGLDSDRWSLIKRQVYNLRRLYRKYTAQMGGFLRVYDIPAKNRKTALVFVKSRKSIACRLKCFFNIKIHRQGFFDTIIFNFLILFGLI